MAHFKFHSFYSHCLRKKIPKITEIYLFQKHTGLSSSDGTNLCEQVQKIFLIIYTAKNKQSWPFFTLPPKILSKMGVNRTFNALPPRSTFAASVKF